jgi:hypothetical protein
VCSITTLLKEVNVQKFVLILAVALVIAGSVSSAKAANRFQVIRTAVPKAVSMATKGAIKFGDGLSAFFWRNKGSIITGTALVTAARNPETVINGTVALVNGTPAPVDAGNIVSSGGQVPVLRYVLLAVLVLFLAYKFGLLPKRFTKSAAVMLLVGAVVLCCGVVRADDFCTMLAPTCTTWPIGWRFWGAHIIDVVIIVVMLLLPTG